MFLKSLLTTWLFTLTWGLALCQTTVASSERVLYPWTFQTSGTLRAVLTDKLTLGYLSEYAGMARSRPTGYFDLPYYRNQLFLEYKTDKYIVGAQIDISRTQRKVSGSYNEINFGNYSSIIYGGLHRSNSSLQTAFQGSLGMSSSIWPASDKLIMLGLQAGIGKVIQTIDRPILRFSATMAASKNYYVPNDIPDENKTLFTNSIFRMDVLGYISKTFYLGMYLQSNTFYYNFKTNSQKTLIKTVLPQYGIQIHINLGKKNGKWPNMPLWQNNGYLLPTF